MITWEGSELGARLTLWILRAWAEGRRLVRRMDRRACKIVRERRLIAITAATGVAIVATIKWEGIGGIIIANMSTWMKDASEIIIDIEIFED